VKNNEMTLRIRSVLVLAIGTVLGLTVSIGSSMLSDRAAEPAEPPPIADEYLALLAEAMQRVRREYVDQIDDETLVENAIRGMLGGLDQHSGYLDDEQYEDIQIATTGNYTGVGLNVELQDGQVTVAEPVDDAPAARAGIRAGDIVVAVDDVPVVSDGLAAAIERMRGEPGTEVKLSVRRGDAAELLDFSMLREPIHVSTVRSEFLPGGFGYIRLSGFTDSTLAELDAAAAAFGSDDSGLKGLVLDLRNNPGGVLQSAIGVADAFLDEGLIVRGSGRVRHARFEEFARPGDAFEKVPLVVLINHGSASGSEIVAGALSDHGRAELIGEQSFGKGSVQSVVPLGPGSALKLTTAHYLTPDGKMINGLGIEPDTVVQYSDDPAAQYRGPGSEVSIAQDEQLRRALESLGYGNISLSRAE
jgi:carboxyl-terminal processing protease